MVRPFSPIAVLYCCHLVCVLTWWLSSVYANIVSHVVTSFNSCTLLQFFSVNHHEKCHCAHYLTRSTCLNENVPIEVLTLGHQLVALLEKFRRCSLGEESSSLGSSFESLRPQPTCHPLFLVCALSSRSEILAASSCHRACTLLQLVIIEPLELLAKMNSSVRCFGHGSLSQQQNSEEHTR